MEPSASASAARTSRILALSIRKSSRTSRGSFLKKYPHRSCDIRNRRTGHAPVLAQERFLARSRYALRPGRGAILCVLDRLIVGLCSLWIKPQRLLRSAIAFKPSTLLNFYRALVQRKHTLLFSPTRRAKPGPKGPDQDLIRAVVDMKQRNPKWGCPRIARQIALAFGISINKDVVRRIPAAHYHPSADGGGPSWLTFIGRKRIYVDRSFEAPRSENLARSVHLTLRTAERCCGGLQDFVGQRRIVNRPRENHGSDKPRHCRQSLFPPSGD